MTQSIDWNLWNLVSAVASALASTLAVVVAVFALRQAQRHKVAERRPWFALDGMVLIDNGSRLLATVKHVSGGIALDVRFAIAINGVKSTETAESPALLPGDKASVRSHVIQGHVPANARVGWFFSFSDEFGNRFAIAEEWLLGGKQTSYSSKEL